MFVSLFRVFFPSCFSYLVGAVPIVHFPSKLILTWSYSISVVPRDCEVLFCFVSTVSEKEHNFKLNQCQFSGLLEIYVRDPWFSSSVASEFGHLSCSSLIIWNDLTVNFSEAKPLQLLKIINYSGGLVKNIHWCCSASGEVHYGKCRRPWIFGKKERDSGKLSYLDKLYLSFYNL